MSKNMCKGQTSQNITTLHTYRTEYNADSVEWCPHEPFQNIFVCANYQLQKSEITSLDERIGRILLFSLVPDELKLLQIIKTAAVLDQKWCHNKIHHQCILGVVNAKKTIQIYILSDESTELKFLTSYTIDSDQNELLILSLDWSTGKYSSNEPEVLCSDSKGDVHRFQFNGAELVKIGSYHGHDYEAWITGFYYWDPNVFFSGGDDCKFLKYDQRTSVEPVQCNKTHEAGVTSMHSNSTREYILATGSYDRHIRLWDIRNIKTCTESVESPGTLWRLKWDPTNQLLLTACMLSGAQICDSSLQVISSYYQHENIVYGADWSHLPIENSERILGTCSFYDNLLCIWKTRCN